MRMFPLREYLEKYIPSSLVFLQVSLSKGISSSHETSKALIHVYHTTIRPLDEQPADLVKNIATNYN